MNRHQEFCKKLDDRLRKIRDYSGYNEDSHGLISEKETLEKLIGKLLKFCDTTDDAYKPICDTLKDIEKTLKNKITDVTPLKKHLEQVWLTLIKLIKDIQQTKKYSMTHYEKHNELFGVKGKLTIFIKHAKVQLFFRFFHDGKIDKDNLPRAEFTQFANDYDALDFCQLDLFGPKTEHYLSELTMVYRLLKRVVNRPEITFGEEIEGSDKNDVVKKAKIFYDIYKENTFPVRRSLQVRTLDLLEKFSQGKNKASIVDMRNNADQLAITAKKQQLAAYYLRKFRDIPSIATPIQRIGPEKHTYFITILEILVKSKGDPNDTVFKEKSIPSIAELLALFINFPHSLTGEDVCSIIEVLTGKDQIAPNANEALKLIKDEPEQISQRMSFLPEDLGSNLPEATKELIDKISTSSPTLNELKEIQPTLLDQLAELMLAKFKELDLSTQQPQVIQFIFQLINNNLLSKACSEKMCRTFGTLNRVEPNNDFPISRYQKIGEIFWRPMLPTGGNSPVGTAKENLTAALYTHLGADFLAVSIRQHNTKLGSLLDKVYHLFDTNVYLNPQRIDLVSEIIKAYKPSKKQIKKTPMQTTINVVIDTVVAAIMKKNTIKLRGSLDNKHTISKVAFYIKEQFFTVLEQKYQGGKCRNINDLISSAAKALAEAPLSPQLRMLVGDGELKMFKKNIQKNQNSSDVPNAAHFQPKARSLSEGTRPKSTFTL